MPHLVWCASFFGRRFDVDRLDAGFFGNRAVGTYPRPNARVGAEKSTLEAISWSGVWRASTERTLQLFVLSTLREQVTLQVKDNSATQLCNTKRATRHLVTCMSVVFLCTCDQPSSVLTSLFAQTLWDTRNAGERSGSSARMPAPTEKEHAAAWEAFDKP